MKSENQNFAWQMVGSRSGMSLVEVMVTMAISMTMSLGVMQAITFSNKAIKSSALSSDWINILQTTRLIYADAAQCKQNFSTGGPSGIPAIMGVMNNGTTAASDHVLATVTDLNIMNASGGVIATILSDNKVIGNLKAPAGGIKVIEAPGNISQQIKLGTTNYYMDQVQFAITVDKVKPNGSLIDGGGATRLISHWKNNNAVTFSILRKQSDGTTTDCYGLNNAAEQACTELGGVYYLATDPTRNSGQPTPKCRLPNIYFGSNTSLAPSSNVAGLGQRIQLWGNHGAPTNTDYAIGMDASTMWLNGTNIELDVANVKRVHVTSGGDFNVYDSAAQPRLGVTSAGDFNTFNSAGVGRLAITNAGDFTLNNPSGKTVLVNNGTGGNGLQFNSGHTGYVNSASNHAEIANDTGGTYNTLMILGNSSAGLGRRVSIWDRLEVNGYFYVNGNADVSGSLTVGSLNVGTINGDLTVTGQLNVGRYVNVITSTALGSGAVPNSQAHNIVNCDMPPQNGGCNWEEKSVNCPVIAGQSTQMLGGFCGTGPPEYPVESMHNAFLEVPTKPVTQVDCFTAANHGHYYYVMAFCARLAPGP